jgi:pentatricopeptide repeat protein
MPYRNLFSWNLMLAGYVKNCRLADARNLFDLMPQKDVVSWNTMLSSTFGRVTDVTLNMLSSAEVLVSFISIDYCSFCST